MGTSTFYELEIPGETRALALVRMVVTSLAEDAGLPQNEIDKIEVAVDEACSNVMEHAYHAIFPRPPVLLLFQSEDDQFVIDILDEGKSFDFEGHVMPKFPDHWYEGHTRGVGLFLIKKCMDTVLYDRTDDDRNRLRLIKRIP